MVTTMDMYVLCDENWGIALRNKPLCTIPRESKTKMQETMGHAIVYTAKHMETLPGKQPVLGCDNYILLEELDKPINKAFSTSDEKAFVEKVLSIKDKPVSILGDSRVYNLFLPYVDTIHVAKVELSYEADEYIENLDNNKDFELVSDSDEQYCFDIVYRFLKYERK